MVEYGYDFVSGGHRRGASSATGTKSTCPLLATLFFFILISNFVGPHPRAARRPPARISITWALAAVSFVYFIYWGIKAQGLGGYLKSFAPSGLPVPMVPIVWFLELFSTVLRVLTLAVRLYGNMFAGHMVLGIFALLTSVFIGSAIDGAGAARRRLRSIGWIAVPAVPCTRWRCWWRSCRRTCSPSCRRCTSRWPRRATRLRLSFPRPHGRASAGGWTRGRGFGHARDVGFHRRRTTG